MPVVGRQHCPLETIERDDFRMGEIPVKLAAEVRRAGGQQIVLGDGGQGVTTFTEI
jgi:hypothetical protein